jgi:hypothetical protein
MKLEPQILKSTRTYSNNMDVDKLQQLMSESNANITKGVADLPNVENTARTQLYGSDPTLDSLRAGEAGKLAQLYEHDKQLAQKYQSGTFGFPDPTNQTAPSGGVDNTGLSQDQINNPALGFKGILNPYSAEVDRATRSQNTANELGTLQQQEAKRRDVLGNTLDKVMKLAQSHIDLEKFKHESLTQQLQMAMQERSTGLSALLSVLSKAGGTISPAMAQKYGVPDLAGMHIPGELELKNADRASSSEGKAIARATADAKKGTTFTDMYNRYAGELPASQIREIYNNTGYYRDAKGRPIAAKESDTQLMSDYGNAKKGKTPGSDNPTFVKLANSLDGLLDVRKGTSMVDRLNPKSSKGTRYRTQNDVAAQMLARIIENGRLSDSDRQFYASKMPQWWMDDNQAAQAIDGLKAALLQDPKLGLASGGATQGGGGVDRQGIVTKLKAANYSDNDIHAYLKQKGIDK